MGSAQKQPHHYFHVDFIGPMEFSKYVLYLVAYTWACANIAAACAAL